MSEGTTYSTPRLLSWAAIFGAIGLGLYFLVPFSVPLLGFSPHVLAVIAGFALLLLHQPRNIKIQEYWSLVLFVATALVALLSAPDMPEARMLHTWVISLMAFWLFHNIFFHLPQDRLDVGIQIILLFWALASIFQVTIGVSAYVSAWFGAPLVTIYSTGLTIYSNNAAIMLLPLLMGTLAFNAHQPVWWRGLVWLLGCVALYFTMSRAGGLALLIGLLVLAWKLRSDPRKMRRLGVHTIAAFLVVLLAWAAPTRVDPYEPGGNLSAGRWSILESDEAYSTEGNNSTAGDYSTATRLITLSVAARSIMDHPLTGVGLGHFPDYYEKFSSQYVTGAAIDPRTRINPHNGYAQFIAEVGIPAFLVLIFWLSWLLWQMRKATDPLALAIYASIAGVAAWLFFHDGLYFRMLWILLGCASALGFKNSLVRSNR